ncbi:glycosyltransferase family 4 protein [Rhizobium oryzicola]|uniref:Glycosyltransferase family 1 protein n=1 Tax=Rhizobium oryzicola TaxID=1232668 RepID=A0ABT8T7Q7_9HYPH|nr:glycosyltransferase family 1 protein [Rhizobium oryzicola]MDO1585576.1 glycosyltransferase family 1 protein [Rhizobium oryzicola]
MKVVLSVQSIKFPLTGIGRYTYELTRHLPQVANVETLRFYTGEAFIDSIPEPNTLAEEPERPMAVGAFQRFKRFVAKSQTVVDVYRFLKARTEGSPFAGLDDHVYHGTNFYVPRFPGASVVTLHDLSVFTMPQFHPRERVSYLGREVEASMKRARRIITDSDYIKGEIVSHFGFPEERISVAKLACGEEFHPRGPEEIAGLLSTYGLTYGAYTLYAGTIEPRKNLANLIEAYGRLPLSIREARPLVLVGYKGWNNAEILKKIDQGTREGWIKYLGYVPADHLPPLLSGAGLFAFPSWYEGFGLPVLEAMASGVPVLTSPLSCIPEVGGDAVHYAHPDDLPRMTEFLEQGLFDESWRQKAIAGGLKRATGFSWKRCAEDTVQAYRLALGHA